MNIAFSLKSFKCLQISEEKLQMWIEIVMSVIFIILVRRRIIMAKIVVDSIPLVAENCPFKHKCLLKSRIYSRCNLECNKECDKLTDDDILELNNWTEITKGLYRYVIASSVAYEIHIIYWEPTTDIHTAKASLYIAGDWRLYNGDPFFERELLLEERSVFECLVAAEKDDTI